MKIFIKLITFFLNKYSQYKKSSIVSISIALEFGISTPPTFPSKIRLLLRIVDELVTKATVVSLNEFLNCCRL